MSHAHRPENTLTRGWLWDTLAKNERGTLWRKWADEREWADERRAQKKEGDTSLHRIAAQAAKKRAQSANLHLEFTDNLTGVASQEQLNLARLQNPVMLVLVPVLE